MVTLAVSETEAFPAVPDEIYPAVVTLGVTDIVLESVSVLVPVDMGADDLVIAVDEQLGTQVHLLAAFGTGVYHNRWSVLFLCKVSDLCAFHHRYCKNRAANTSRAFFRDTHLAF